MLLTLFGYLVKDGSSHSGDLYDLSVHKDHELVLVLLKVPLVEDLIDVECAQEVGMDQPQNEKQFEYFVQEGTINEEHMDACPNFAYLSKRWCEK